MGGGSDDLTVVAAVDVLSEMSRGDECEWRKGKKKEKKKKTKSTHLSILLSPTVRGYTRKETQKKRSAGSCKKINGSLSHWLKPASESPMTLFSFSLSFHSILLRTLCQGLPETSVKVLTDGPAGGKTLPKINSRESSKQRSIAEKKQDSSSPGFTLYLAPSLTIVENKEGLHSVCAHPPTAAKHSK